MSRIALILPALSLAVLLLCAYYPAIHAGFIMDDDKHFLRDNLMTQQGGLYRIWFNPDRNPIWNYWPISRTSFWIERHIWGVNAAASHAVNVFLHLTGVLIFYFGLRRFRVPHPWFIAGLFALHPVFAESVTWISERKNSLSGVFYLLCIWSYLSFDENRKGRCYVAALLLFACALLSKSSTIMLPVILILCRLALGKSWARRDFLQLIPFFLLSIISAFTSIWFEQNYIGSTAPDLERNFAEKVALAGRIPFFYLGKIFFPYPLIFIYPKWEIDTADPLQYLPALVLTVGALVLMAKYQTWGRYPLLGLAAFVVTLFPVLGFFNISGMRIFYVSDHWAYLPALPVLLTAGLGLGILLQKRKWSRWTLFGAILLACGILTWRHNHVFQSPDILYRDTIAKNPSCWAAHSSLGSALESQGRLDEAIAHHLQAIRINPKFEYLHLNLGTALHKQGKIDEAVAYLSEALRINPYCAQAHNNLGFILIEQGQTDAGIESYLTALRVNPEYAQAHFNLGNALLTQGQLDRAINHYSEAVRVNPEYVQSHNNLGIALLRKEDLSAAISHFRQALRYDPNNADAHNNLGVALRRRNEFAGAIDHFREALRINPDNPSAKINLKETLILQDQNQ